MGVTNSDDFGFRIAVKYFLRRAHTTKLGRNWPFNFYEGEKKSWDLYRKSVQRYARCFSDWLRERFRAFTSSRENKKKKKKKQKVWNLDGTRPKGKIAVCRLGAIHAPVTLFFFSLPPVTNLWRHGDKTNSFPSSSIQLNAFHFIFFLQFPIGKKAQEIYLSKWPFG